MLYINININMEPTTKKHKTIIKMIDTRQNVYLFSLENPISRNTDTQNFILNLLFLFLFDDVFVHFIY